MLLILKLVRYSSMLLLVFLILVQNPKVDGASTLIRTTKYFNNIQNTEDLLVNITWTLVLIFFISTIFLVSINV